jgi:hypothetical protein
MNYYDDMAATYVDCTSVAVAQGIGDGVLYRVHVFVFGSMHVVSSLMDEEMYKGM